MEVASIGDEFTACSVSNEPAGEETGVFELNDILVRRLYRRQPIHQRVAAVEARHTIFRS